MYVEYYNIIFYVLGIGEIAWKSIFHQLQHNPSFEVDYSEQKISFFQSQCSRIIGLSIFENF